ncbi:DUF2249 domain-containing protein [Plantactinospora sp. GCM10030261]|uniref:DUF2249 domain-containing protein n=1 Tax=Plantactinospora sp. GCM10030261 TaxID=3273420 RepID=UPI00361C6CF2
MSHPDPAADGRAADAVVRHHAELATALTSRAGRVVDAAAAGDIPAALRHRTDLARWLHEELLPHAYAEEAALYPAAAALDRGALLVEGMLDEHRAIAGLVAELEAATGAVAARALAAVFDTHLAKENDLVVPLLVAAPEVSLAGLLDGMHDLVGGHQPARPGNDAPDADSGGGCGGTCGCGGDTAPATAEAPVLSIDERLDVRNVPHAHRHAQVLSALDGLPAGGALVLVAPHAPRPLLAQIDKRYGDAVAAEWLQDGPEVWQIRLHRVPVAG